MNLCQAHRHSAGGCVCGDAHNPNAHNNKKLINQTLEMIKLKAKEKYNTKKLKQWNEYLNREIAYHTFNVLYTHTQNQTKQSKNILWLFFCVKFPENNNQLRVLYNGSQALGRSVHPSGGYANHWAKSATKCYGSFAQLFTSQQWRCPVAYGHCDHHHHEMCVHVFIWSHRSKVRENWPKRRI